MQFRICDIREDAPPVSLEGTVSLPNFASVNVNIESMSEVKAVLTAEASARVCRVRGDLSADVAYRCSRCLTTFDDDLTAEFDELFTESEAKADDDTHWVKSERVVLDDYVAETMQLALEYRPLCRVDCKGLCPNCGRDLNEGDCGCQREALDPRLEVLRDLLSDGESE